MRDEAQWAGHAFSLEAKLQNTKYTTKYSNIFVFWCAGAVKLLSDSYWSRRYAFSSCEPHVDKHKMPSSLCLVGVHRKEFVTIN